MRAGWFTVAISCWLVGCGGPSAVPPAVRCPTPDVALGAEPGAEPVAEPSAAAPAPTPAPPVEPAAAVGPRPTTVDDFLPNHFEDDDVRTRVLQSIPGSVVPESGYGADRVECGGHIASVIEQPLVKGGPSSGSLVVGTADGKTRAVVAPRKPGARYRILGCAELTGDGTPELVAATWGSYSLILSLGAKVTTIYEGPLPFPEVVGPGKTLLHVRDTRLERLGLQLPGVLLPLVPTWWSFDGQRFVERTRDVPERLAAQRNKALELGAACLAAREVFCEERLAAFFAGSASVVGDGAQARGRLPNERTRQLFDELLGKLTKGGAK